MDNRQQQLRFDDFRQRYNHERPHEALGQQTPASVYRLSPRLFPNRLPEIQYPGHFEVRRVSRNGGVRWNCRWVCVSHVLGEEYVGFEEIDDGLWEVFFGPVRLGRLNERDAKIEDDRGREYRKNVLPMSPDENVTYLSGRSQKITNPQASDLFALKSAPTFLDRFLRRHEKKTRNQESQVLKAFDGIRFGVSSSSQSGTERTIPVWSGNYAIRSCRFKCNSG